MSKTSLETIAELLAEFFKDDPRLITMWWHTKNPMLGDISPAVLYIHRPEKVAAFIKNCIDGNTP